MPTFESLHNVIWEASEQVFYKGQLYGLQEAIIEIRALRMAAENSHPETVATSMILFRIDRLIDDLETRAALLKKSIEG